MTKFPRSRPASSKCAAFSGPPLLETFAGLPPASSATVGERLRASRGTFAAVPRTLTVSVRCSPGERGEESASKLNSKKVIENGGAGRLAQETSMEPGPGSRSVGGSTITANGDDASTKALLPATRTVFASASPQKPLPVSSNRSVSDAKLGAEETCSEDELTSAGVKMVV